MLPEPDPVFTNALRSAAQAAAAKHYRDGMTGGVILTLESLLNICAVNGGVGSFKGALPENVTTWARDALANAQEQR